MPEIVERDGSAVRSALFLDFDNIYLGLTQLGNGWAERFATQPQRWTSYLENELIPPEAQVSARSLLVRRCYLNPVSFGRYRPYFIRSAFQVIDCPPLTARSKNSSDIQMVMDVLDVLQHPTHFDEFIVMSSDADFTPLMLRLRAHDRRTVIVTSGPAAQAYKAACSHVVSEEQFVESALRWRAAGPAPVPATTPEDALLGAGSSTDVDPADIARLVGQCLSESEDPVPLAVAAQYVIRRRGVSVAENGWGGTGSFGAALRPFLGENLKIATSPPPGWVYDPQRHEAPEATQEDPRFADVSPDLRDFIERVASVTGVPRLPPRIYRIVYEELAAQLAVEAFGPVETTKALRDRCKERGVPISRAAATFVAKGISIAGYRYPAEPATIDPRELAEYFFKNVRGLCENARMELSPEEGNRLLAWLMPWEA